MLSAGSPRIVFGRSGATQLGRLMRRGLIPDGPSFVREKACIRNLVVNGLDAQRAKLFALPDAYSTGFPRSFHGARSNLGRSVKTLAPGNDGIAGFRIAALRNDAVMSQHRSVANACCC
jgi:hypothetical protein